MAQEYETPIYWDQHASRWNITLIFSLVVAVLGIFSNQYILVALGLAMGAWSWFTTPRQYILFRDRMTIVYGMPRTRIISLGEIAHSELLSLPFGERLRIRMNAGNRIMLMMRDPSTFRGHLEDALTRYHGEQTGDYYMEGTGTVLSPSDAGLLENEADFAGREDFTEEVRDASYGESSEEPSVYTGRVEEASSTSGSYVEVDEGPYETPEPAAAPAEQSAAASGSYTETAEPDYSGEGSPAYSADVELETGVSDESEEDRPPSPY